MVFYIIKIGDSDYGISINKFGDYFISDRDFYYFSSLKEANDILKGFDDIENIFILPCYKEI